ncbi:MAG: DUF5686 family protein [Bacteroidota bacterium]
MNRFFRLIILSAFFITAFNEADAQQTIVKGKVIDANTGDPVPFANVFFQGTTDGVTTDFVGYFTIKTNQAVDSVIVSYIGYKTKTKAITRGITQELNFQIEEQVQNLEEIVFVAEENPAFAILRNVVKNKKANDKRSLDAYEYESYNKIEFDIDNITDKFRERKLVKKVTTVLDSIDRIAGEDGKPVLPIFISESISKFYYRKTPTLRREHILKTKITGVGITDGSLTSQLIGSSFQEYNFYQNWLNIVEKDFISPIADGWKLYYDVYLTDSLYIDDHFCYRIDIEPKREQDLAFNGSIWITKDEYALKQVDVYVDKSANLNFIEKIKIQQELEPTAAGPWIPTKSRVLIDVSELAKNNAGILAKFYTSNKDWVINEPKPNKFYNAGIEVAEDARQPDPEFWDRKRHDPLTPTEKNVIQMIDTLRNITPVRRLTDIVTYLGTGYISLGKIDFGPYPLTYATNNIEQNRFRLGFRTNVKFSRKWIFSGYAAYGTLDERWKYSAGVEYIASRKPWTKLGFSTSYDIEQIGLDTKEGFIGSVPFETFVRNRRHVSPYLLTENRFYVQTELSKGLNEKIILKHRYFDPIFNFAYITNLGEGGTPELGRNFTTSEVTLQTRFGKDEIWIQNDNERLSLGTVQSPVVTVNYTLGVSNLLDGDFTYHDVSVNAFQSLKLGLLGTSTYSITARRIFEPVPFLLLEGHLGNETIFYIPRAYNLMDFFEFVSDSYVSLNYRHQFQGFLLNRVPLFKKLKWRFVGTANLLYGGIQQHNRDLIPDLDAGGNEVLQFRELNDGPYVELGYGIENIFKVFRIDAFHRLTYLDRPDVNSFGVKVSFQLIL